MNARSADRHSASERKMGLPRLQEGRYWTHDDRIPLRLYSDDIRDAGTGERQFLGTSEAGPCTDERPHTFIAVESGVDHPVEYDAVTDEEIDRGRRSRIRFTCTACGIILEIDVDHFHMKLVGRIDPNPIVAGALTAQMVSRKPSYKNPFETYLVAARNDPQRRTIAVIDSGLRPRALRVYYRAWTRIDPTTRITADGDTAEKALAALDRRFRHEGIDWHNLVGGATADHV